MVGAYRAGRKVAKAKQVLPTVVYRSRSEDRGVLELDVFHDFIVASFEQGIGVDNCMR